MRSGGKGKSMSDVEKEIDELQCKLTAKTREIETLVAEKLNLGDIDAMEGTAYDRLRTCVEELIEKWQRADVDHPGSNPANGSKCTYRRARGNRGANSYTASAMKESRQRSAVARASQSRWQRLSLQRVSFRLAIHLERAHTRSSPVRATTGTGG